MNAQLAAHYPGLAEQTVFISGGATGIGESLVRHFAAQKAKVAFVDINAEAGETLAAELNDQGATSRFIACDITDTNAYQAAILAAAEAFGPIGVLVNNAANDIRHTTESLTSENFDALIQVNLKHSIFAIQTVKPMMQQLGGGSIINFGSVGWMMATAGYPVYAASKAATHGLTRGMARELGQDNIRINTLVPGWVMTEKQLDQWVDDEARELIKRSQCMSGYVLPEHIAQMALFLASDASVMCSAQNFIVDGGWV
ncbi:MAG: SDR family NAD(P)-dependent oxidoreductase [Pontibacterium sp.]